MPQRPILFYDPANPLLLQWLSALQRLNPSVSLTIDCESRTIIARQKPLASDGKVSLHSSSTASFAQLSLSHVNSFKAQIHLTHLSLLVKSIKAISSMPAAMLELTVSSCSNLNSSCSDQDSSCCSTNSFNSLVISARNATDSSEATDSIFFQKNSPGLVVHQCECSASIIDPSNAAAENEDELQIPEPSAAIELLARGAVSFRSLINQLAAISPLLKLELSYAPPPPPSSTTNGSDQTTIASTPIEITDTHHPTLILRSNTPLMDVVLCERNIRLLSSNLKSTSSNDFASVCITTHHLLLTLKHIFKSSASAALTTDSAQTILAIINDYGLVVQSALAENLAITTILPLVST